MNKYEKALAQTSENIDVWSENKMHYHQKCKPILIEAIKKAQALDRALDLIKQKREFARLQLVALSQDENSKQESMCMLNEEIATYTDCIVTIETEMGRK